MSIITNIKSLFGGSQNNLSDEEYTAFKAATVELNHASTKLAVLMTRFKWDRNASQDPELIASARRLMREALDLEDRVTSTVFRFSTTPGEVDQPRLSAQDCAVQMAHYSADLLGLLAMYGDDVVLEFKAANRAAHLHKIGKQVLHYLAN